VGRATLAMSSLSPQDTSPRTQTRVTGPRRRVFGPRLPHTAAESNRNQYGRAMSWVEKWHNLSARIDALARACELMAHTLAVYAKDHFSAAGRFISPEIDALTGQLVELKAKYGADLPPEARTALERFLETFLESAPPPASKNEWPVIQRAIPLAIFRSEFQSLLDDGQHHARTVTELAFEHLRRTLVVDSTVRASWATAFDRHETSCERLGAVHLLSFGIWAFKLGSGGAATDLVYGDPVEKHMAEVRRAARAFVLTEWKRVKEIEKVEETADQARRQMQSYQGGLLADIALTTTKFVVLVSKRQLAHLDDLLLDGSLFRHINIPVDPEVPSKEARRPVVRRTRNSGAGKSS
jgi:hypothetical protein